MTAHDRAAGSDLVYALATLLAALTPTRRRLLAVTIALMLAGAIAELATIGAVLPFLALVTDPSRAAQYPALDWLFERVGRGREGVILTCAVLLILIALAAGIVRLVLTWVNLRFILLYGHDLGRQIFARLLRQPYRDYVTRNSSVALASFEKLNTVVFGVLMPVMQGLAAAVISFFIIACLFLIDPVAASAAGILLGATYFLVTFATRRRLAVNSAIVSAAATGRVKTVQEGLGGIRDILIDNSQPVFERVFAEDDRRYRSALVVNNMIAIAPRYVVETSVIVLIAGFTVYFAERAGGLIGAIPILGALAIGAQRPLPLIHVAYTGWTAFIGNRQLIVDVAELMRLPINPVPTGSIDRLHFSRELMLDHVSFQYGTREEALRDVSLTIRKGERIGFVGRTGSGKSTLIDVLMGLLPPTGGEIRIDGRALDESTLAAWQAQIAHVPQAIYLTDGSITANIAFGVPPEAVDVDRVRMVAEQADVASFIASQPQRYDTAIGERGIRLSGGQRQRIGIARALYKGATVLVFDEATSALDEATEAAIMNSIYRLAGDVTLLLIAHRVSTLSCCDRIVRLDAGRIVDVRSSAAAVVQG